MSDSHAPHGGHHHKSGFKRQDFITLLITFVFGLFCGGYLYVTGFAPQIEKFSGQTEEVYEDLVVIGNQYGGFRTGSAPSFQVLKDGSFRYLPATPTGEAAVAKEGIVPRAVWNEVKKTLDATLYAESRKIEPTACASYSDGIDYRYDITRDSVIYALDTCGTNFSVNAKTALALDKLWKYFETVE